MNETVSKVKFALPDEVMVKCPICVKSTFVFSSDLLDALGEVTCECGPCRCIVRVSLYNGEIRIYSGATQ